jgi:hypothetical protein
MFSQFFLLIAEQKLNLFEKVTNFYALIGKTAERGGGGREGEKKRETAGRRQSFGERIVPSLTLVIAKNSCLRVELEWSINTHIISQRAEEGTFINNKIKTEKLSKTNCP